MLISSPGFSKMTSTRHMRPRVAIMAIVILAMASISAAASVSMAYCATINTSQMSENSSIYQSDGLCSGFCEQNYAFAIVKDMSCWCSDYAPAKSFQEDISECDTACPGFPPDTCGGNGLWGYMRLSKEIAGTAGASSSAPSQTESTSTETDSPAATPSPSPSFYVSTVTASGGTLSLQTVTVVPTTPVSSGGSSVEASASDNGLSTGQAVGVAVGILAFFIIIGAIGVILWLRRRTREQEQASLGHQNSFRGSSAGIMSESTPRTDMASVWDETQSQGTRNSKLMPHDPRMDPYSANIYNRYENKSHESVNTLRDDHDYSRRVLRTTNPDPDVN